MGDLVIASKDATYTGAQIQLSGDSYYAGKGWRNFLRRARYNGYSLTKQVLVDSVKAFIGDKKRRFPHEKFPKPDIVLAITMDECGSKVNYKTFDDIPEQDVPCPCGNPKHWIIRYKDLRHV